jgi:hypothetical protein
VYHPQAAMRSGASTPAIRRYMAHEIGPDKYVEQVRQEAEREVQREIEKEDQDSD